jgi:hypothetical protein
MEQEHRIEILDRRTRKINEQQRYLANRKQIKVWLRVVSTVCILEKWHRCMKQENSRKLIELKQTKAVCRIQRVHRLSVNRHSSKAMMQIILKMRRILWILTFKVIIF